MIAEHKQKGAEGMEKRLQEHLMKDLPMLRQEDVVDIACLMTGKKVSRSLETLTASIVHSKVEIGILLSSLLRYQWMVVQGLMTSINPDNLNAQLRAFSQCIERFSGLQNSIVTAFDRSWHAELEKEVSARVVAESNAQWLSSGLVHLHNFFNEMPVVAKAKYKGLSGGMHLTVQLTPEVARVFACTDDMQQAYINSPDRKHMMTVGVIHCRNGLLSLTIREVERALRESRENVRIRLQDPVALMLPEGGRAALVDISASGLRLEAGTGIQLHEGDSLSCSWMLADKKIEAEAVIRWVRIDGGVVCAGLKFGNLGQFSEMVRKFMFAQQQMLVGRLKQLGTPSWVKDT